MVNNNQNNREGKILFAGSLLLSTI